MRGHAFVVFDVDDVLLDMDRLAIAAQLAVLGAMQSRLPDERAQRVYEGFAGTYDVLRSQLRSGEGVVREDFARLHARLQRWQRGVTDAGHEVKIWSRQTMLAVALEDEGVVVTRDLIEAGAGAYWRTLAEGTEILPDARRALAACRDDGAVVQLATNSDGWLTFDETAGTFTYDPDEAVRQKLARLEPLWPLGLEPADVSVGDPVGKPHRAFFEQVVARLAAKAGRSVDLSGLLAVGDSLTNDILPLLGLGARHGVWVLRSTEDSTPERLADPPGVWKVKDLDEVQGLSFDD